MKPLSCDPFYNGAPRSSPLARRTKDDFYSDTFMNTIRWNNVERLLVQMTGQGTGGNNVR
jgi:hypothetical protein